MARIPEAWPLLLDREQLLAFTNLPDDTIDNVLTVAPIVFGGGILRWNRQQVEEWVQSLKSDQPPISAEVLRKREAMDRRAERNQQDREITERVHAGFLRQAVKRIRKAKLDNSVNDAMILNEHYIIINEIHAADLLWACGDKYKTTFELIEDHLRELKGQSHLHRVDRRPAIIRAQTIVRIASEHFPHLNLLSVSSTAPLAPRRSPARR